MDLDKTIAAWFGLSVLFDIGLNSVAYAVVELSVRLN